MRHRLADGLRSVVAAWSPTPSRSSFVDKGVLTPEEFVEAGDQLSFKFPAWQWQGVQQTTRQRRIHLGRLQGKSNTTTGQHCKCQSPKSFRQPPPTRLLPPLSRRKSKPRPPLKRGQRRRLLQRLRHGGTPRRGSPRGTNRKPQPADAAVAAATVAAAAPVTVAIDAAAVAAATVAAAAPVTVAIDAAAVAAATDAATDAAAAAVVAGGMSRDRLVVSCRRARPPACFSPRRDRQPAAAKLNVAWLPEGKQYIISRNVPCRHRVRELEESLAHMQVDEAEGGWTLPPERAEAEVVDCTASAVAASFEETGGNPHGPMMTGQPGTAETADGAQQAREVCPHPEAHTQKWGGDATRGAGQGAKIAKTASSWRRKSPQR
eukprot:GHVT01075999.1.p1 GENE.GHVT01075999.1~~GHVT01075999.1.p1  ORF type:complete len:376 (+),score=99.18 GHVT01075999.1:712-1839(+)